MKNKESSEVFKAKPLRLSGLVRYQTGSIISRQVIRKEVGNVTVFAFDKGESLSEHTAPFDAFVYILEGEAQITISGSNLKARKGDMVIMPANEPHAVMAQERFKMLLVMIRA